MNPFDRQVSAGSREGLYAAGVELLQVNLGLYCNQSCLHCHLAGSPERTEVMEWPVMEEVLDLAGVLHPRCVDLTGGAPEGNPHFRRFVSALADRGHSVKVRTNLTILAEPGLEDLPRYFRDHGVRLVASLPCYGEINVDAQRGKGVFRKSVEALRRLNAEGYGADPGLFLDLVYNPGGDFLPGDQPALQEAYRGELYGRFGIRFNRLHTITNMPIGRFAQGLKRQGRLDRYLRLLRSSYNPATVDGLMCRRQVSIGWDGTLYDCDFNLALGLAVNHGAPDHIYRFDIERIARRRIVTGSHCFGCTAGHGSSCGGALA